MKTPSFQKLLDRRKLTEVPKPEPRIRAELSARALKGNYTAISELVPGQGMLPMIKANAYGHGSVWAARTLLGMPGLYGFGVATLDEGVEIRAGLGPRSRAKTLPVIVFSGALPWSDSVGQLCEAHQLTPVIASDSDWQRFLKDGWPARIPYQLKFNTGMNRLGMSLSQAAPLARALRGKPTEWHPQGAFTHLAMGESPDSRLSLRQREGMMQIRSELSTALPATLYHLANSAAIWQQKHWGLNSSFTDLVRPGLALYGVPPWKGAPARGIEPAMKLSTRIIAIHLLKPGESLGYGAAFSVGSKSEPVRVAVLSAGYADGVHRTLGVIGPPNENGGQGGHAWISGQATRFLGRISMDLSAIRCPAQARIGDSVEILGPDVEIWAQAEAAKTIPYELLTSVSGRVERVHD